MSKDSSEQASETLFEQNKKDQSFVNSMKENPRKAIIRELSKYWNFQDTYRGVEELQPNSEADTATSTLP